MDIKDTRTQEEKEEARKAYLKYLEKQYHQKLLKEYDEAVYGNIERLYSENEEVWPEDFPLE